MKNQISLMAALLKQGFDPNAILVRLALRKALLGCDSVLDVGCGFSTKLRELEAPNTTGFEGYQPDFEEAQKRQTHDHFVQGDARDLIKHFRPNQFDACIAMDVIEHFTKEDGLKLMQDMEQIAAKKVIFFTPNGFLPQKHAANDDLQAHLSGWEPADMQGRGYKVYGQLGPKPLRGECHALRKPAAFWGIISMLWQILWTSRHPNQAAAILGVKTISAFKQ